jgi:DNA-binding IclR family transcriptional regulator
MDALTTSSGVTERKGPLSVDRVLGVIGAIAVSKDGMTLTGLSETMSTPKTSLLNLLPGLVQAGYLQKQAKMYVLGPSAFELASQIIHTKPDPIRYVQPLLQRLALDADKTVTLAVLADNERMILHVAKEEPPDAMRFSVEVGAQAPVHTTAGGRVMLAFGSGAWSKEYLLNAQLSSRTSRSIIDKKDLQTSIANVKIRGYAVTRGETYETVGAISAPVFDRNGFAFALVAAGAVEKISRQEKALSDMVKKTADEISQRLMSI